MSCENCNEAAFVLYYCEFCERNFCVKCTLNEAHEENYMETIDLHECKQIHITGDDVHEKLVDSNMDIEQMDAEGVVDISIVNSNEIQNCQCGRERKQGDFECKECRKLF